MRVVPVIDIQDGRVVAARFGDRASYRPIETPLAPSSDPATVAAGLLAVHPFSALYIADLDGIALRGRNDGAIADIAARHPSVELWVDNGIVAPDVVRSWLDAHPARLVLGSESDPVAADLPALGDRVLLSLDHRGDAYVGPPELLDRADLWPPDVVVMTLSRVGSGAGPDLDRLAAVAARARAGTRLIAAGGVRGRSDLEALAARGIAAALVATALHDGRLDAAALAGF